MTKKEKAYHIYGHPKDWTKYITHILYNINNKKKKKKLSPRQIIKIFDWTFHHQIFDLTDM